MANKKLVVLAAAVGLTFLAGTQEAAAQWVQVCKYVPTQYGLRLLCYMTWVADAIDQYNRRNGVYQWNQQHQQQLQQQFRQQYRGRWPCGVLRGPYGVCN